MRKITPWISILSVGLFFVCASPLHADVIRDFKSTITVLPDASIIVEEQIVYDFENNLSHGIYRDIVSKNSEGDPIILEVISVSSEKNESYLFSAEKNDGHFLIKIGDPEKLISGIKEYYITYRVLGAITYYDQYDEIYWNATGNDWNVKILKSEAMVILPANTQPKQQSCYYGPLGSSLECGMSDNIFSSGTVLNEKEGLTVAVGFPKGSVSFYQAPKPSLIERILITFWPLVIPIGVFILMFTRWLKKGRDPKGKGVIIPQYDVPDNLTPLEVSCLIRDGFNNKNISAEIIYLATQGFIKVRQIEDKILGLIPKKDYEFTLLKEEGLLSNEFDRKIVRAIFGESGEVGGVAKLSDLNNTFYKYLKDIYNSVIDGVLAKKYYKNFPKLSCKEGLIVGFSFALLFVIGGISLNIENSVNGMVKLLVLGSSLLGALIIWFVFNRLMPAKTKRGVEIKEYLLGLKKYLEVAEKDRIEFHNAPEKKPEIFEKLLPYAMVFSVEEDWAREFEGIYTTPPSWYEGQGSFSVVTFGHEIALFNTLATGFVNSTPNSSGSGGGGFSGGGGGGGGGGSW